MSRRSTGAIFILSAALLYAARYLSAAIWGAGVSSWNSALFNDMYGYIGPGLTNWALAALVVGLLFIIWGEIEERRS